MEYKKILLQKGLKQLSEYQFRKVKSLLSDALELTPKMKDDADRIKIADLMFAKFPGPKCVLSLIDIIKEDAELKNLTSSLRREIKNVTRRLKTAEEKAMKKQQQDRVGPSAPACGPVDPGAPREAAEASVAQARSLWQEEMEYKKILLQKGLKQLSEYQFRKVKSLLSDALELTPKMRDDADRIKIADLMFAKFPGPKCVLSLIDIIKEDAELKNLTSSLRREIKNVTRRLKTAEEKAMKKQQQDRVGPSAPACGPVDPGAPREAAEASVAQKRKNITQEKTGMKKKKGDQQTSKPPLPVGASPSRTQMATETISLATTSFSSATTSFQPATPSLQAATQSSSSATLSFQPTTLSFQPATLIIQPDRPRTPSAMPSVPTTTSCQVPMVSSMPLTKETPAAANVTDERRMSTQGSVAVLVLERSCLLPSDQSQASMFHATVATASQFFHVKVFEATLWELFAENSVLTISGHSEHRGTLEVTEASAVSLAPGQIQVPPSIMRRARKTPKIDALRKAVSGTSVYGLFKLAKKTEKKKYTVYEIQDNTGSMDVLGSGRWHRLPCEPGDKLRLFYLRLRIIKQNPTLTCEKHSLIQVVNRRSLLAT